MKTIIKCGLIFSVIAAMGVLAACSGTSTSTTNTAAANTTTATPILTSVPPTTTATTLELTNASPGDGETNVPLNQSITATFTEGLNPATVNGTSFTLKQGTVAVPGVVSYYGNTAIFVPQTDLIPNSVYTVSITNDIANMAGLHLQNNFYWTFTTGQVDTVTPYVVGTVPSFTSLFPVDPNNPFASNSNVPTNDAITAYFNEVMDPRTINNNTFTLMQGTTPVTGTVSFDGYETAIFTPASDLAPNTSYTATITSGVACSGGNTMLQNLVWSFTTGSAQTTIPVVVSTLPNNLNVGVPVNKSIAVTFSEAINPLSINTNTFTVWQGTTPVQGTVSFDGSNTAVFNLSSNFSNASTYTATITTGVTDLAGIHMANKYSWTFTTGAAASIQPIVVSTSPADHAIGVLTNSSVSVTFNEGLNPTTVAFTLIADGRSISGTINYDPTFSVITFTPGIMLSSDTVYTASIKGFDLGGYSAAGITWTFTTAP